MRKGKRKIFGFLILIFIVQTWSFALEEGQKKSRWLAAGDDKNLWIIDVESKKANQILHLESEKEYLAYLAWHPSARQISLSIETRKDNRFETPSYRVLIKDLEGKDLLEIKGTDFADWSPQGSYFYYYTTGSNSRYNSQKVQLFKADDLTPVDEFSDIIFIRFSRDEKKIALGRIKKTNDILSTFSIEIRELENRHSWKLETEEGYESFFFSPDSRWVVCDEDIFNLETKEKVALPGYPAIFSPDARYLALLSSDVKEAMIFDLGKKEIIWSGDFEPTPTDIYRGAILGRRARFSSDGKLFIYNRNFWSPDIIIVELGQLKERIIKLELSEPLELSTYLSPDGQSLALFKNGSLWLFNLENNQYLKIADLGIRNLTKFKWAPAR